MVLAPPRLLWRPDPWPGFSQLDWKSESYRDPYSTKGSRLDKEALKIQGGLFGPLCNFGSPLSKHIEPYALRLPRRWKRSSLMSVILARLVEGGQEIAWIREGSIAFRHAAFAHDRIRHLSEEAQGRRGWPSSHLQKTEIDPPSTHGHLLTVFDQNVGSCLNLRRSA